MDNISVYFNTLRYLRFRQIIYQLWYRIKPKISYSSMASGFPVNSGELKFTGWIEKAVSLKENTFCFLNKSMQFSAYLPVWNFTEYGMLWNYNINYMDYLLQPGMDKETGMRLITEFNKNVKSNSHGLDPYPVSLRGINWIKFYSKHNIDDSELKRSLYKQYIILYENPEYHLMGNHLLENGFSLLFGAFFFRDKKFYSKARVIVSSELKEQVLDDGAHFELSPMYHQIILDRLLDCINLIQNNEGFEDQSELLELMRAKASLMLKWMNSVIFKNGELPMMNDSARKIAPTAKELNEYAIKLEIATGVNEDRHILTSSGYLCIREDNYECVADTGSIGASYQPGHAHADTFSFELHLKGQPLIVDTGVSTYEKNSRRQIERSTASHNTVEIAGRNSSQVWDGFRVGARAQGISSEKTPSGLRVCHNGYKKLGIIHEREFSHNAVSFTVCDRVHGKNDLTAISRFHFHPGIDINVEDATVVFPGGYMRFENVTELRINDYLYAPEFNKLIPGKVIEANFSSNMKAIFQFSG